MQRDVPNGRKQSTQHKDDSKAQAKFVMVSSIENEGLHQIIGAKARLRVIYENTIGEHDILE